jgi:hypothetical protein
MVIGALLGALVPGNAAADPSITAGQILVKFRDNTAAAGILRAFGLNDGPGVGSTGAHLITVPDGKELQLVEALGRNPVVEYAEPDYVVTPASDDTYFPRQYALQNTGQSFTNTAGTVTVDKGTADADVDAVEAWTVTTGTGIKVAVSIPASPPTTPTSTRKWWHGPTSPRRGAMTTTTATEHTSPGSSPQPPTMAWASPACAPDAPSWPEKSSATPEQDPAQALPMASTGRSTTARRSST